MARTLLLESILACDSLETLTLFALSNLWKSNRLIFEAIEICHDQLKKRSDCPSNFRFGDEDYLAARQGHFTFPEVAEEPQEDIMGDFDLLDICLNQIGLGQPSSVSENNIQDFFELSDPYCERIKRFRTEGHTFSLKLKNLDQSNITTVGSQVFTAVLDKVAAEEGSGDSNRFGVCFKHPSLERPVLIPFRRRQELTGDAIMTEIQRVMQSVKSLKMDEEMSITITHVHLPSGEGNGNKRQMGLWQPWWEKHSNGHGGCFIKITNSDSLCLARAIVVAQARAEKDQSPEKKHYYKTVYQGGG
jgi:hypothetical protein